MLFMTVKEALQHLHDEHKLKSLYSIAKALSGDGVTVQPVQIRNYIRGGSMRAKTAERFLSVFNIYITDAARCREFEEWIQDSIRLK